MRVRRHRSFQLDTRLIGVLPVISNPMDLQTVQKKVKSKQYKSKKEFADDLDLIWSNCYTYNTGEVRPWSSPQVVVQLTLSAEPSSPTMCQPPAREGEQVA